MKKLTHLDDSGEARMVDVTGKAETGRTAIAEGLVRLSEDAFQAVRDGSVPKGDVMATARVAGIMAAKKTAELIPLCHPLPITGVTVDLTPVPEINAIRIAATVKTKGQTGVEMEALTAVSVAALTVYDMVKAIDKGITIEGVRLVFKEGGKSGTYRADETHENGPARATVTHHRFVPRTQPQLNRRASEIMSSTSAPRPAVDDDRRRLSFRRYMIDNRMRVTQWAQDAGLPAGLIYGYLHGRTRRLSEEAEASLAKAARASVKAVFGD
jgi:cyclic pyranopterin phosphate synthase